MWRQRDEQRPSRPPHPPPWHLNLKLRSAAGTRLFRCGGETEFPNNSLLFTPRRIQDRIRNPDSRSTSPSSALGVRSGSLCPSHLRARRPARGQSAASRRPRGRRTAGRRGAPAGPASPSRAGAGRQALAAGGGDWSRASARRQVPRKRAPGGGGVGRQGKTCASACGRVGCHGLEEGGGQLTSWAPTWGAR